MKLNKLYLGDCLELMKDIPDGSVDLIKADLPYQITANKWDIMIPFDLLWVQYNRILKPTGVVLLNSAGVFSAMCIMSNLKAFKYDIIWQKTNPKGHLNAKKQLMRAHESILVFYTKQPTYNPQMTHGHKRKVSSAHHKRNCVKTSNYGEHGLSSYDSTDRYPISVQTFKSDVQKTKIHPTQKPVALEEWLIKTYSNEGDTVLDNCSGSGTTAVACIHTNRNFICIEKDAAYYEKAVIRINETYISQNTCPNCKTKNTEIYECNNCYKDMCENCQTPYNQFSQIDYNCCNDCY